MSSGEISIDAPIEDRIAWAEDCYQSQGALFLKNQGLTELLSDLKKAVLSSRRELHLSGIIEECSRCVDKEGGSCCGAGLEDKYSGSLLLINLLLGCNLPHKRPDPKDCYFLGKEGCTLMARHVICVNYLCKKITDKVEPGLLKILREKEGRELEILFILNEKIKKLLRI